VEDAAVQSQDKPILRGALIPTLLVGAAVVGVFALVWGRPGLVGAALGVLVVTTFFSISWVVISSASRRGPAAMMGAAFGTYLVKIVLLGVLLVTFRETSAFDFRAFAWTILVGVICWSGFQVWAFMRQRTLYVEPDTVVPEPWRRS
jgi:ATP synthase protein I